MFWKILTHDFRPPIQGGDPLCDGRTWPVTLPDVPIDRSASECGVLGGWHFCRSIEAALKLGGMWPSGRPSAVVAVEPLGDIIERGDKCRAASLRLLRTATDDEIADAIRRFSAMFAPHADRMAEEQIAWRAALSRPERNVAAVECGLRLALDARKLGWSVKQFSARDARDAWATWNYAWNAKAVWDSASAASAARDAWDDWNDWSARNYAWNAKAVWDSWAASAASAARDARDAITVCFASLQGWIGAPADTLSVGLRDAYAAGLDCALPIAPNTLGWAMVVGDKP